MTIGQNLREGKRSGLLAPPLLFSSNRKDLPGISSTTNNNIIITFWLLGDKCNNLQTMIFEKIEQVNYFFNYLHSAVKLKLISLK